MKTFKDFITENEEWEHSQNGSSGSHFFTHKTTGDKIRVYHSTAYGKVKNSRLRDPSKTKTFIEVDHTPAGAKFPNKVIAKAITRAENTDARERKAKAAQSVIKHVQKHHGVDVSQALRWI